MDTKQPIRSYQDLDVFQRSYKASIHLCKKILPALPKSEQYDLVDQLSRSSKAVPRLIAEGYGKRHQKLGFQKYIDDAMAESNETQVGLCQIRDLYPELITLDLCNQLIKEYDIISRQLYKLRESWQNFKSSFQSPFSHSPSNPASQPQPQSRNGGFTLIELILVVALISIITSMSAVFYSRFLTQNAVLNTVDQLVGQFHKAQIYAISGKQNSSWGVNYGLNTITLYSGNSYVSRNSAFDEKFIVNSNISISGFTDLNFTRVTGIPGVSPTIMISGNNNTKTIIVNGQGVVSR